MTLLTIDQVAERCQVSTKTVKRAIDAGDLRASQLAERGCWRIYEADVDEWIEARANRPREPRGLATATKPIHPERVAAPRRRASHGDDLPGRLELTPSMGRRA